MAAQTTTYSGAPFETQVDEVRFLVQDTDPDALGFWLLTDQELQYLVDTWLPRYDSLTYVAAVAAGVIARKFVGIVSVSADGVSVNTADLADRYRQLAAQLRNEYKAGQIGEGPNIENLLVGSGYDPSIRPLRFGVGLHDNYEAGNQDYGGVHGDIWIDSLGVADELDRW